MPHKGRAVPPKPLGSPAANAGPRSGGRQRRSPAKRPSIHPNVLACGPFCFNVQMIEVQAQVEPLFSLGVLEVAAKSIGISLRLETCPAEDGAS